MTSVHDHIDAIEAAFKKDLIGFGLRVESGMTHSRIRKHAVFGDDGISFDTVRSFHGGRNFQMHPDTRRDSATADYIFLMD